MIFNQNLTMKLVLTCLALSFACSLFFQDKLLVRLEAGRCNISFKVVISNDTFCPTVLTQWDKKIVVYMFFNMHAAQNSYSCVTSCI